MVRLSKEGHFVAAAGTSLGGCGAIETASKQTETEKVDIPNWRTATRSENRVAPAKRSRGQEDQQQPWQHSCPRSAAPFFLLAMLKSEAASFKRAKMGLFT